MAVKLANVGRWLGLLSRVAQLNHPQGARHRECRRYAREAAALADDAAFVGSHIYRKMIWYMVETLWLGLEQDRILERTTTPADRRRYALMAPVFAVADFLIDDTEAPLERIRAFIQNPDLDLDFPHRAVFRAFNQQFSESLVADLDQEAIWDLYFRLHEVQLASRGQKDAEATPEMVDPWVRDKTGLTFQLNRLLIPEPLRDGEWEAWYELGALTQYCNDIQDLHKDLTAGVRNFVSVRDSLEEVQQALREQQSRAYRALASADLPKDKVRRILFDYEAFVLVMEARLAWYHRVCGGQYEEAVFSGLSREAAFLSPFHPYNLRRSVLPLLRWQPVG